MKSITKEQEYFLYRFTRGTWELNQETKLVDIDVAFNCSDQNLPDFLGIEFGKIKNDFNCSHNKLVSLEGAPKKVGYSFYCHNNQLVSLEGAPQEVGLSFDCSDNQLVSLEGGPQEVVGAFYCYNNNLVSLEGAPQKVGWDFVCDPLPLRGCPIDLLDKIYFYRDDKSFILKDLLNRVVNGLAPEIYLKKCYE